MQDFGLVSFETLAVEDKKSMMTLLQAIDRAGGYAFGGAEGANDTVWQVAMREGMGSMDIRAVQERWIDDKDEYDELDRKEWATTQATSASLDDAGGGVDIDDEEDELAKYVPKSGVKVVRRSWNIWLG